MRRFLVVIVLLGFSALPATAFARTILVLGDSLSAAYQMDVRAGWVALLEQRLAQQKLDYQIVNASISGDTTANGLARLPPLLKKHHPAIVVIELGGNDGLRGLPLEQMKHNIRTLAAKAKSAGAKVLLLGIRLPPNYGSRYTERFQQVYKEVAAEQRVALLPFILDGVGGDRALMQQDGIHPSAEAQPRVLENVWGELRKLL
ncbi:MAG: arylesterase [Gammaproteobacteria bacterium]|nr:arylesterase [Gammaproteobacteria bacterium]